MLLLLLLACGDAGKDPASNQPPSAPIVAVTPDDPTTLDALVAVVQGGGTDPDGDAVTFTYAWFVDGADAGVDADTVPADRTARGETWRVVVTPSDGTLEGEAAWAEVTVRDSAPAVTLTLDPELPTAADAVTVVADATDADDDPVALTWSWTRDGVDAGRAEPTLPVGVHARGETWAVTAVPSDGELDGAPATLSFTVANAPPSLGGAWLEPAEPTLLDPITVSFTDALDADGDAVSVSVRWEVDGVEVASEEIDADGTSTLAGLYARGQVVRAVGVPFDGYDEGAPVEASLVVADAAPSATGAAVSPQPLTAADVATCVGEGWTDPDGDAEGWQTTWTVNGVVVSTDPTLASPSFARGDVVGCSLVPDDGERTGDPVSSAAVTVENAAPTCAAFAVTIGPDPATVADTLSVTAETATGCADADGDPLARVYDWQVDGASAGATATLAGAFARGQTVTLVAGWSDGFVTGATATSNPVSVVNDPPVLTALSIAPSPAYTDDELSVLTTTTDLEGDPVGFTYAWTVDGVAAGTGATLGGSAFRRGQTVAVTVTPDDGYDAGTPVAASLVVQNSAPNAPTVAITPAAPEDTDPLVCAITAAGTDDDGDAVTHSFAWTVGGVAFTATTTTTFPGDTVPAASTALGQTWACAVTASDGTASAVGTDSVVVGCDRDGDGHSDVACGGDDCDDADAGRHPGAAEVCDGAGEDEDCDGLADDADPSLVGSTWYPDLDGDGYGDADAGVVACTRPTGYLTNGDDCDDTSNQIRPGGTERCDAADVDEDCDGLADDADSAPSGRTSQYIDRDGDGYGDETASSVYACPGLAGYAPSRSDCDDADPAVSPAAEEVCDDGIDNDCSGASYPCGLEGSGGDGDEWHLIAAENTGFGGDIATGDFNGDGARDIVSAAYTYDRFSLFYGPFAQGSDTESADDVRWSLANDWGLEIEGVGDVTADGYDDLAVLAVGATSRVYLIEGGPALADTTVSTGSALLSFGYYGELAAAGDFDDDGVDDLWVADNGLSITSESDALHLYRGDAAGPSVAATWTNSSGYWAYGIAGGEDWDGDGIDDALATIYGTPSALVLLAGEAAPAGGAVTTADGWVTAAAYFNRVLDVGDIDGDGHRDAALTTQASASRVYLFQGPPTLGLSTADAWVVTDGDTVAAGDVDDDGQPELFVGWGSTLSRYALPLTGPSLGTATATLDFSAYYPPNMVEMEAGADYSGDGVGDLLFSAYSGSWTEGIYLFTGGTP